MRLAEIPTTNLRIVVTLGVYVATAFVYLGLAIARLFQLDAKAWEPNWDWLAFIAVMSGLDAAQFFGKRKTHQGGCRDGAVEAPGQVDSPVPLAD